MWDREDYQDLQERLGKDKRNGHVQSLEYLVQAQVKMDRLTGDENWDRFLSYLQSSSEAMNSMLTDLERELIDPSTHDPSKINELKLAIARMMGRIETMDAVISLPKEIRDTGEKARERLKGLEQGISKGD